MNAETDPLNAIQANMIVEESDPRRRELDRAMNRIFRHIRGASMRSERSTPLPSYPYVDARDVRARLEERGFKVKGKGEAAMICW